MLQDVDRLGIAFADQELVLTRAGWPVGTFQNLLIGSSRVERVIADERVAAVTLTGSEGAGVAVAGADTAFNVQSAIHSGVPTDPRFGETHLRNAALPVCNAVAAAATPGNVIPRAGWS